MSKSLKVQIQNKVYSNSPNNVLQDCNLEIKPQDFVTILGGSGCGKSTLLKLISGLDTNFNGEIFLGNKLVKGPSTDCGFVFQELRLFPWMTVKDNVVFALKKENKSHQEDILKILKLLNLDDFYDLYPNSLSGGMSQKLALARALINIPNLLLLDEPFASLDYISKMRLQNELVEVLTKFKTTVLMVTHDIEEAVFVSDKVLIMSPRPSKIVKTFKINLKKPRDRTSKDFLEIYQKVLDYMMEFLHIN
jgi:ABC-type nitrate/sulfonate/bicarbonate transport system ATPase subunit